MFGRKPKVFVTRQLPGTALQKLGEVADMRVWPHASPPPYEALIEGVSTAQGLLTLLTDRVDANLLRAAPHLKVVSNVAVGYDNIDVAACAHRGIWVANTPGVLTETTADFAFALILAAARRLVEADRFVRSGQWTTWDPNLLLGADVYGATLGIVGLGKIGRAVASRARGFGMTVLYCGRRQAETEPALGVTHVSREELLARSDFVSLHVPLTPQTRGLIGRGELARMKKTAFLINTARGPVVDAQALRDALFEGRIAGAALDVMDPEPLPASDPLLEAPHLTVAPHIASATVATRARMAQMAVEHLLAGLSGRRPAHCVNP